jgi:hypothetical protein
VAVGEVDGTPLWSAEIPISMWALDYNRRASARFDAPQESLRLPFGELGWLTATSD